MKQYFRRLALAFSICFLCPQPSPGAGNDNPTGVTGDYNGNITTGGSYDPYTGNAKRFVTDLTVTGGVGAYPLKWTRVLNTRVGPGEPFGQGGTWSHSYQWGMWVRPYEPYHYEDPPYEGPDGGITYPDGRALTLKWDPVDHTALYVEGTGSQELDRIEHAGGFNYDLLLADGGRVKFVALAGTTGATAYSLIATQIVDPHGQTTILTRDSAGRLSTITEPAGRYLQIHYHTYSYQYEVGNRTYTKNVDVISRIDAFAGPGRLTETVNYVYTPERVAPLWYYNLTRVNYGDSNYATYSYLPSDSYTMVSGRIQTCNDVRYAGAMSKIKYEYLTTADHGGPVAVGQIKKEKNLTTGDTVSEVIYPPYHEYSDDLPEFQRTEKRGDGKTRSFQYSNDGHAELMSYTDFKGKTSEIRYEVLPDNISYRKTFKDARGKETATDKETNIGAVKVLRHPGGATVTYEYSDPYLPYYVALRTDENGKTTRYTRYPGTNQVQRVDYPDGGWEEFIYNGFGQVRTHKRTNGVYDAYDHFEYDARGRLRKRWDPTPSGDYPPPAGTPYSRFEYYDSGLSTDRVHFAYDQMNRGTEYSYDGRGNVTRVKHLDWTAPDGTFHPDGSYTQSFYNPDGTLAWSADENHPGAATDESQRTRYQYDEYKRVEKVKDPMGHETITSYALDWVNPLLHTTKSAKYVLSPMGKNVVFGYDANFRKEYQVAALGTTDEAWTLFDYDEVGNLFTTTDPRGKITTFGYDDRNRQTSVKNEELNETTILGYDGVGNKISEIRPDAAFRTWDYDAMNRLWHAYDWRLAGPPTANQTTTYGRDIAGNVRTITDTKGAIYEYGYDLKNLKTSHTYPVDAASGQRKVESYLYDAAGSLEYVNKPGGQWKQVRYDNRNRPWHSVWLGNTGPDIETDYDAASRVQSVVTKSGGIAVTTVAFGYDDANRKVWEDQTLAGHPTRRVQADPDEDGKRRNLQVSGAYSVTYDYTERNQLKAISGAGSQFNYVYDVSGNMTTRQALYNGVSSSTHCPSADYDPLNRPTTWEQTRPGGRFALSSYRYDRANREVATWREQDANRGERFTYELTNQLATAAYNAQNVWTGTPQNATRSVNYAYTPDKLNRDSMSDNGDVTTYSPNALNQYENVGGGSCSYDANFNFTGTGGLSFIYNAANQVVSARSGEDTAQFVYDGLGRIVKRTINGVATVVIYDGWKPVAESYGNWVYAWNVYGPGADEVLVRYQNDYGYIRFHPDRHGNVAFLLDNDGTVREKYTYDAFGRATVTDWNGGNPRSWSYYGHRFLFQGREFLVELGVYDYRNRFYHPILGRFLQTDPTGFGAGDMNLFRYCGDDPVDGSDPTGLVDTSATKEYSPLTSFGGGDWVSGMDGMSYNDKRDHFPAGNITMAIESRVEGPKDLRPLPKDLLNKMYATHKQNVKKANDRRNWTSIPGTNKLVQEEYATGIYRKGNALVQDGPNKGWHNGVVPESETFRKGYTGGGTRAAGTHVHVTGNRMHLPKDMEQAIRYHYISGTGLASAPGRLDIFIPYQKGGGGEYFHTDDGVHLSPGH